MKPAARLPGRFPACTWPGHSPFRLGRLGRFGLALLAGPGCTPFADGEDYLSQEFVSPLDVATAEMGAEMAAPPAEPGSDWSCLSPIVPEQGLVTSRGEVERWVYSARVLSLLTGEPVAGVTVQACAVGDVVCAEPVSEASSDAEGWVDVPLRSAFAGYFELEGAGLVSATNDFARLSPDLASLAQPLAVLPSPQLAAFAGALGVTLAPATGVLSVRVFDCQGVAARGVRLAHNRGGVPWYFVDGLPSGEATVTGAEGTGGFLNVAPGVAIVDVYLEDGRPLALSQSVLVRPGWVNSLWVDPSGGPE